MAKVAVENISLSGASPTFAAADSTGDYFVNDGKTYFHVKNGDTVGHTVTINSQKKCNFGFDHDVSVTVSAGSEIQIGPFPRDRFNDSSHYVHASYDAVTSVTVAAASVKE